MKKNGLLFLADCLGFISCNKDTKIAITTKNNSISEKNLEVLQQKTDLGSYRKFLEENSGLKF